jgi:uncharacterized protein
MERTVEDIFKDALALPAEARAALASRLRDSLAPQSEASHRQFVRARRRALRRLCHLLLSQSRTSRLTQLLQRRAGQTAMGTTMVEFSEPMTRVFEGHRPELVELCRKYRVRRLDVFGSAARGDFNEHSSDVDLLVEFDAMPHADRADAYLGFLTAVEALLRRRVDLLELHAVRNPYLRRGIEESRELVYAA